MVAKKLKVYLTIAIFLLIFSFSTLFFIQKVIPAKKNIQVLKHELQGEKVKPIIKKKAANTMQLEATNLQKRLPVVLNMDSFILDLGKAEVTSGSTIKNIDFGDDQTQGESNTDPSQVLPNNSQNADQKDNQKISTNTLPDTVKKVSIQIMLDTPTFFHLYRFLEQIESFQRITSVDTIEFQGPEETNSSQNITTPIQCTVSVSIFYDPTLESELKSALPKLETPDPSKKEDPFFSPPEQEESNNGK